jgi:Family of unknown function (DUF6152)
MPPKAALWILVSSLAAAPALAHHAVSLYDMKNPVTVQGVVSRVEWTNPHAYVYLSVKNDRGRAEEWAVELDSPSVLVRRGWSRDTLKPGDSVTCRGGRSKSGARAMKSATVELPGGRKLRS